MPSRRLALIAVALASLASCRGGCARKAADTKGSPPTADAIDKHLALVPANAGTIMVIDVAKRREAPILANVARGKTVPQLAAMLASAETGVREYAKETGFHAIRDVDTVVVAMAGRVQSGAVAIV